MVNQKKIILSLAFIALLGTVTNYIYFSPILTLLVPLCIYVVLKEKLQKPVFWLYIFLSAFLISVALYDFKSLFDFDFYRRDGNFIISYAPLLILPLFSFQFKLHNYFRTFYCFSVGIYAVLFLYYLVNLNFSSSIHGFVFGGLFYAQNAVGGFLSILGGLGFSYFYHRRNKKELAYFLLVFLALIATYSRGSILGLLLGLAAWYLAINKHFKTLIALLTVPVLLTIGSLMVGYPYFQSEINTGNIVEFEISNEVDQKNANIIIRIFYTFPRAYYVFKQSPVVGTGVGSYDDRPLEIEEVIPYVAYNAQAQKAHTDSHAHHSYLHILAEQGILGLTVFLIFWLSVFWYLMNVRKRRLIRDFLLISYFAITFASFTEHRITTPSMMLPFTISLGLFMAHDEKIKIFKIIKNE